MCRDYDLYLEVVNGQLRKQRVPPYPSPISQCIQIGPRSRNFWCCKPRFPMPGLVKVVVLEFKGVSSSSKPSAKSLKVSMGKRQYQTWDRGEFSFPVSKLREDLVIALLDASGNEIARSDILTTEIIEKRLWDEVFSISESGHVHLRLQFSLSEEERNRIRIMRESAIRKKNVTDLSSEPVVITASKCDSVEKSMDNEVKNTDSQKKFVEENVASPIVESPQAALPIASVTYRKDESVLAKTGTQVIESSTDTSYRSPSALSSPSKHGVKILPPKGDQNLPADNDETQQCSMSSSTVEVDSLNMESTVSEVNILASYDQSDMPMDTSEKDPSNVRKMIVALEKHQFQSKSMIHMNYKMEAKALRKVSSVPSQLNRFDRKEPIAMAVASNVSPLKKQEETTEATELDSETTITERYQIDETCMPSSEMLLPYQSSAAEGVGIGREITLESSTMMSVEDYIDVKPRPQESYREEYYSGQSSGMWVFPDNSRRLCITTLGMKIECDHEGLPKKISSESEVPEKMEANLNITGDGPDLGSDGSLNKRIGQVVKIAALLGFGVLVLFNREKEPRKRTREKEKSEAMIEA